MSKIYTKTGDAGETGMLGGVRVSKSCLEMQAIGEVDETNAVLGLIIAELEVVCDHEDHESTHCEDPFKQARKNLLEIQNKLFVIGSNLAALQTKLKNNPGPHGYRVNIPQLTETDVKMLENWIDEMDKDLPKLENFILPGGDMAAAQSFVARAICRRAERCLIGLNEKYLVDGTIKQYLNRLSDCLFTLGRWINLVSGVKEVKWQK